MEDSSTVFKVLMFLTFSLPLSSSDTHYLQFLYTAVTPGLNFPEFTAVGLMDGEQCVKYDSNISKIIPKTEWMQKFSDDDAGYWNYLTRLLKNHQDHLQHIQAKVMEKQTEGSHTPQWIFGCELHDDNTTRGYDQYGYDGEDFFRLDPNTGTWTADNDKAGIFIKEWDPTGGKSKFWRNYLKSDCIDQLRRFLSYGRETVKKKDPPTSSVFQKHSPSPEVVCHATGFFPKEVNISWRKDGEAVKEDVELRETLPNQDGSFQKRIILKVPAEDLQKHKYTCVIQHSSLKEEMVLEVPKGGGSDGGSGGGLIGIIIGVVVPIAVVAAIIVGMMVWKNKNMWRSGRGLEHPHEVQEKEAEINPLTTPQ